MSFIMGEECEAGSSGRDRGKAKQNTNSLGRPRDQRKKGTKAKQNKGGRRSSLEGHCWQAAFLLSIAKGGGVPF